MRRKTDIFEEVLTSPYNHNSFVDFVREFLNDLMTRDQRMFLAVITIVTI